MNNYTIRRATKNDLSFLADVVIHAEKGNSNVFSYMTLFGISEESFRALLTIMFEEDVDGCEFSVSSFLVVEFKNKPIAAFGGWIEGFKGSTASKILKSNLLGFTLGKAFLGKLKFASEIVRELIIEREPETLQLEYLFILENHRGKRLTEALIQRHIADAMLIAPQLQKAQVQCFSNNTNAVKAYERYGFTIVKRFKSTHQEVLNYLPFSEKLLMEKKLS